MWKRLTFARGVKWFTDALMMLLGLFPPADIAVIAKTVIFLKRIAIKNLSSVKSALKKNLGITKAIQTFRRFR